jgi:hypothetical protein
VVFLRKVCLNYKKLIEPLNCASIQVSKQTPKVTIALKEGLQFNLDSLLKQDAPIQVTKLRRFYELKIIAANCVRMPIQVIMANIRQF